MQATYRDILVKRIDDDAIQLAAPRCARASLRVPFFDDALSLAGIARRPARPLRAHVKNAQNLC
jgi:hypothetical protein